MPSPIKIFHTRYQKMPEMFSLSPSIYLSEQAENIPDDPLKQTDAQKSFIQGVITQINKDQHRTCYLDLDGKGISNLKAAALISNHDNRVNLAPGAYPSFTQGDYTGASISEVLFNLHYFMPKGSEDPSCLETINLNKKYLSFAYRNAKGEPAGFSIALVNDAEDEQYNGFIITTIHNTTAHPKNKKVTVLSSPNFVTTQAKKSASMDSREQIDAELSKAIQNDKVTALVKGIFNDDGSLNSAYIQELMTRIQANTNIDNRDEKMAQLHLLLDFAAQQNHEELNNLVLDYTHRSTHSIDFFKEASFKKDYDQLVASIAQTLKQEKNVPESKEDIQASLDKYAKSYAETRIKSEKNYLDTIRSSCFTFKAQQIQKTFMQLKFDNSPEELIRQQQLNELSQAQHDNKKERRIAALDEQINAITPPKTQGFFSKYRFPLIAGISTALVVGLVIGFALFPLLPILTTVSLSIGIGLACGAIPSGIGMYLKEKQVTRQRNDYNTEISNIPEENKTAAEQALNQVKQELNQSLFLKDHKPDCVLGTNKKKDKELTPEHVAYRLWLKDKGTKTTAIEKTKFTLWAEKNHLNFGIKEVDEVIKQKYTMKP